MTPITWSFYGEVMEVNLRRGFAGLGVIPAAATVYPPTTDGRLVRIFHGRLTLNVDVVRRLMGGLPGASGGDIERDLPARPSGLGRLHGVGHPLGAYVLISRAEKPLARLRGLSPPTTGALPALRSAHCQADPMLSYIEPYRDDIASAIVNMASSFNSYDLLGHLARISVVVGENSLVGLPPSASTALASLFHTGVLSPIQGMTLDPYPPRVRSAQRGCPPLARSMLWRSDER